MTEEPKNIGQEWITTDNVSGEVWRRLLEYANTDFAERAIVKKHGLPNKADRQNYKKQAQQIRVCILQAQEYFTVASEASVITSPNLLFYGIVALSSAVMLLLGDGTKSLDGLRQDKDNRHHGLNFSTSTSANLVKSGFTILKQSFVDVRSSGHFVNWYTTLPEDGLIYATTMYISSNGQGVTRREAHSKYRTQAVSHLPKRSLLELIQFLPDLAGDMVRFGEAVPCARINCEIQVQLNDQQLTERYRCVWRLHNSSVPGSMQTILDGFSDLQRLGENFRVTYKEGMPGAVIAWQSEGPEQEQYKMEGMVRESLMHEQWLYAKDVETHEIVDAYQVAYGLSMLARYYPDYWISCLDSHCVAATVIESLVGVLIRKFPILALSLMEGTGMVISIHRPPWHQ